MKVVIRGERLPGRTFSSDVMRSNVHVGVQVRKDPEGLVPGDAPSAEWCVDVTVVDDEGVLDFKGPAVQGKKGERFLYLTWGDVGSDGSFDMFRRAKLMLNRIDPTLVRSAQRLTATVDLTDSCGEPRCARVDPPALKWTAT